MQIDLTGQVALVTGSARRVGKAIALELARAGVSIMVHHNNTPDDVVKATVRDIRSLGVDAKAVQADLRDPAAVQSLFDAVRTHYGRLHILVNSASNFQKRGLLDVTIDEWRETIDTNLTGPFLCTQAAVPMMRANDPPGGVIVNILDRGATDVWVEYAHHGISKAGLLALTRVTAASVGPQIRANGIIPGLVMKPTGFDEDYWQRVGGGAPIGRPGTPEDVGRAVVYLAREDFLTGAILNVDGGYSLR